MQCMYQKCIFSHLFKMCISIKRYDNFKRLINSTVYAKYNLPQELAKNRFVSLNIDENTLTGRLWHYINQNNKPCIDNYISQNPINLNSELLAWRKCWSIFHKIQDLSSNRNSKQLQMLNIDCCIYLHTMSPQMILICLSWFMKLAPNLIINMSFYKQSIDKLVSDIEFMTVKELIQFMFYVSLQKKNKQVQGILRKCMRLFDEKAIDDISTEELCIICNSTFKSSTKISNNAILEKVNLTLGENLHLLNDTALFITLIKSLRQNSYQSDDLLNTISCVILFNKTHKLYSYAAICHILALYASYFYYDNHIMDLFRERCLDLLTNFKELPKHVHVVENIRMKDIHRFMWAYSTLGYKLQEEDFVTIISKMLVEINVNNYRDVNYIFDIIFYMWVLNYQAVDLLSGWITEENIRYIEDRKCRQRFNLLLTCLQLENLKLYKTLNVKQDSSFANELKSKHQILHRPQLLRVYNCLTEITPRLEQSKFDIGYQIPHLEIVGITGYKKNIYKNIFIEVLDDYVCVKNRTSQPAGIMQLKLRLLENMEESLIIIPSEDIKLLTDSELKEHLEREINKLPS